MAIVLLIVMMLLFLMMIINWSSLVLVLQWMFQLVMLFTIVSVMVIVV